MRLRAKHLKRRMSNDELGRPAAAAVAHNRAAALVAASPNRSPPFGPPKYSSFETSKLRIARAPTPAASRRQRLARSAAAAWDLPATLDYQKKHYKTNGNEHLGPTGGSMDPPWDLVGCFLVRPASSWGASKSSLKCRLRSTWPSQGPSPDPPWSLCGHPWTLLDVSWFVMGLLGVPQKYLKPSTQEHMALQVF